jgi:hypothetical protein
MQGAIVEFQYGDDLVTGLYGVRPSVSFVDVAELVDNVQAATV